MNKYCTTFFMFTLSLLAFAGAERPGDRLLKEVSSGTSFKIKNKVPQCPEMLVLETSDKYLPDYTKPGDIHIHLTGYENTSYGLMRDTFTHENNSVLYRPGLSSGSKHKIDRDCELIAGVACRSGHQMESGDTIKFEHWAGVLSLAMIAKVDSSIEYNSKSRELKYVFKANGIEDVICSYLPDPSVKSLIDSYEAQKKAEWVKADERASGKEVTESTKPTTKNKKSKASQQ